MPADSVVESVPDGPQVQVVRTDLEVLLHVGEIFVGGHGGSLDH
jgi:hypothetical protein